MIKIAHRGNFQGKDALRENTSEYVNHAISMGYHAEVDVRLVNGLWYLGHDTPGERISLGFLERPEVWAHAKNFDAYLALYNNPKVHTFWHNMDDFVFTSKGIKWAYAGIITYDGVMVMPELFEETRLHLQQNSNSGPLGVCSDNFALLNL